MMINKTQILSGIEHYFRLVLDNEDAYSAVNAEQSQQDAYKQRVKELMMRVQINQYLSCSFPRNGKVVSNIDFQQTPMVTAIEDLIPNATLPSKSIALEFEINYKELLKPAQQNGFHISQTVVLADEIEHETYGKLIRIAPLYQVHNFTTGQNHYTISAKDLFLNTNIDILKEKPDSVLLLQNAHKEFYPLTSFEYQNLGTEMSCTSSLLQWLIALSCDNVELIKGAPPLTSENEKRLKKNKPKLRQYHDAHLISTTNKKPIDKLKFGQIYLVGEQKIWKNL